MVWLSFLLVAILSVFWYNAWVYALPTPIPSNYISISNGTKIHLPKGIQIDYNKPVFLHFFNPDCPCSRFNLQQFTSLVKQYGTNINFVVVPISNKSFTSKELQKKTGLSIPVWQDTSLAKSCGVYSTPQAVIINTDSTLYYRGNYNKNRYCTDKETSYAKMAIENILSNRPNNIMAMSAITAYGCSLPKCSRK